MVPLIKVGRDLAPRANNFLATLTHRSASGRFVEVPEPNNRVTLTYRSATRRTERVGPGGLRVEDDLEIADTSRVGGRTIETERPEQRAVASLVAGKAGPGSRVAGTAPS